jgi:hypothetical protein
MTTPVNNQALYGGGDSVFVQWTVNRGDNFGEVYLDGSPTGATGHGPVSYFVSTSDGTHTITVVSHGVTSNAATIVVGTPTTCTLADPGAQLDGVSFELNWSVDTGSPGADVYIEGGFYASGFPLIGITLAAGTYHIFVTTHIGGINSNEIVVTVSSPTPINITSVQPTGGGAIINFDNNVTANGNGFDGTFSISSCTISGYSQYSATAILISTDIDPSVGDSWFLSASPSWINEAINAPVGDVLS